MAVEPKKNGGETPRCPDFETEGKDFLEEVSKNPERFEIWFIVPFPLHSPDGPVPA